MKNELEMQLVAKYPDILKSYGGPPDETCMAWGIECGDGWYRLLDQCMAELQYLCDKFSTADRKVEVHAQQIKEKYGTLRFYVSVENANEIESLIIYRTIDAAESESANTCEVTGKSGKLCLSNTSRWYRTLCREEAKTSNFRAIDSKVEEYWEKINKNENIN